MSSPTPCDAATQAAPSGRRHHNPSRHRLARTASWTRKRSSSCTPGPATATSSSSSSTPSCVRGPLWSRHSEARSGTRTRSSCGARRTRSSPTRRFSGRGGWPRCVRRSRRWHGWGFSATWPSSWRASTTSTPASPMRCRPPGRSGHEHGSGIHSRRRRRPDEPEAPDPRPRARGSPCRHGPGRRPGTAGAWSRAVRHRPARRPHAGARRLRHPRADRARREAPSRSRDHGLGARGHRERSALHRDGGGGLPAQAIRPRPAPRTDQRLPDQEAPARSRARVHRAGWLCRRGGAGCRERDLQTREPRRRRSTRRRPRPAGACVPAHGARGGRPRAGAQAGGPPAAHRDRRQADRDARGRDHRDRLLPGPAAQGERAAGASQALARMAKIISVHSFRGGTGKSNMTANVATLLASSGQRIGVVDTDIQSPGIHVLFGMSQERMSHSLNDYLWGRCEIGAAAHDVTASLDKGLAGRVFLIPSSSTPSDIARVMHEGYDVALLNDGVHKLIRELELDALIIDTHPGLNEETLLSIAICEALAIVMRPDQQDYEGTSVAVSVARKLSVPRMVLVVNNTPAAFDLVDVKERVETTYECEVAAVLPHSDELMTLASEGIFALRYPDHPITALYRQVATCLTS